MSEQSFPARAERSANVVRASTASFSSLGVSKPVVGALAARGFESPFAVQRLVIADVLAGRDVLAQSPTGSGKTLAFGVPMVDLISAEARRPAGLILAPTRELAGQIVDELPGRRGRPRAAREAVPPSARGGVTGDKPLRLLGFSGSRAVVAPERFRS